MQLINKFLLVSLIGFLQNAIFAQSGVSINNDQTPPNASAMLDVNSPAKGILIPRVNLLSLNTNNAPIADPATGLLIYNTNVNLPGGVGFYYNNGTPAVPAWAKVATTVNNGGWLLNGNAGTNPANNFIGTIDEQDLIFKRNGAKIIEITKSGSLLFTGDNEINIAPTLGAGKRMMWLPFYGAFRMGGVDGNQWDGANVAGYSFAVGRNVLGSGYASVCMGVGSQATKNISIAIGENSMATDHNAVAIGSDNFASGASSTSIGNETVASAYHAVAIGNTDTANGAYATALGFKTRATGEFSTAMGNESKAEGNHSIAAGFNCIAKGRWAIAIGRDALTTDDYAIAIRGKAKNIHAIAIGGTANNSGAIAIGGTANGQGSMCIGITNHADGDGSTALGSSSQSEGVYSISCGYNTVSKAMQSFVTGHYNDYSGMIDPKLSVPTDPLFQVGNGINNDNRSNALTLYRNGNMTIQGDLTAAGILNPSDIRLKKDIKPLKNVLTSIDNIQPITYYFKDSNKYSANHQIGFSAQEIETFFPELIKKDKKGFLSVNYSQMSAVAIQAIKEQRVTIKKLEAKLEKQEIINQKLNKKSAELENRINQLEKILLSKL